MKDEIFITNNKIILTWLYQNNGEMNKRNYKQYLKNLLSRIDAKISIFHVQTLLT